MLRTLSVLTLAAAGVLGGASAWSLLGTGSALPPSQDVSVGQWGSELQMAAGAAAGMLAGCVACILVAAALRPSRQSPPLPGLDAVRAHFDAALANIGQGLCIYDRHARRWRMFTPAGCAAS